MPRTSGVSTSSTTWFMRRRPRPRTVATCPVLQPAVLLTSFTLIFLSAMAFLGRKDFLDLLAAFGGDLGRRVHRLQALQRGAHDVVRIGRAEALGEHVGELTAPHT